MAFGSTPADANNIPMGCVYVPGVGLKALQGGTLFTDASSNDSAPARMELVGGSKVTYTYAINATAPYATPTDWIVIRGSASKTIKIIRVELSGLLTTSAQVVLTMKKHTIANTAGTSTNPTPVKHDSNDGTAAATILLYSAAPTIDATATIWKNVRIQLAPLATTATLPDRYLWTAQQDPAELLTLRGVAQEFALNLAGQTLGTGFVMDVAITWTEE